MEKRDLEFRKVSIREDDGGGDGGGGGTELSIIDIKAAIAEQGIPISELYNKQDLASNRNVVSLIHEAEVKLKTNLEKEIIILKGKNVSLQKFRDKTDTVTLVVNSPELTDKGPRVIEYIKARLGTGRGVDLAGDLTDAQRQDKVNEAITEELKLIEDQGITFKTADDTKEEFDDEFADQTIKDDMSDPKNNSLIPR